MSFLKLLLIIAVFYAPIFFSQIYLHLSMAPLSTEAKKYGCDCSHWHADQIYTKFLL